MPSRATIVDEILNLHELMTKHVVNAGVGAQRWAKLVHNIGRRSDRRLALIHSFMQNIHRNEWKDIDTTWNLPCATEEMWENMGIFDETFPEMKRLQSEQRRLKDKWISFKNQYSELIRSEKEDSENHGLDD